MRWYLLPLSISLICILAYSCKSVDENNAGIPPNKMEKIMWDMHRAYIYAHDFISMDSTKNDSLELNEMKKTIFEKYKVSEKEYEQSYQYYLSHPNQMIIIIDSIQAHSKKQTRVMEKIFRPE